LLGPKLACYAAIIALYEEGDRIFLSGFSRGADTVRSVAGVMTYCGVPRHMPDGSPPAPRPKDHPQARRARCQGCSIVPIVLARNIVGHRQFLLGDARRYRRPIQTAVRQNNHRQRRRARERLYFIGVFDTVAALGHKYRGAALVTSGIAY